MNPDRFFGMRTCTWVALFLVSAGCFSSFESEPRDGAVPIDGGFDAGVDVGAPDAPTVRDVSLRVVHSISREPIAGAEVAFRGGDFASTVRSDERGIARTRVVGPSVVDVEVVVEGFVARTSLAVQVEELDGVDYPLGTTEYVTLRGRCLGRARDDSLLEVVASSGRERPRDDESSFTLLIPRGVPIELRCQEIGELGRGELLSSARAELPALDADRDAVELLLEPARTRTRVVQVPRAPVGHSLHDAPLGVVVLGAGLWVGTGRVLGRSEDAHEVELTWAEDVERPLLHLFAGVAGVQAWVHLDELASFSWMEAPSLPRRVSPGSVVSVERAAPITFVGFGEEVEVEPSWAQILWTVDSESPSFVVPEPPAHLRTFPFSSVAVGSAVGDRLEHRFDQISLQGARP